MFANGLWLDSFTVGAILGFILGAMASIGFVWIVSKRLGDNERRVDS